MRKDVKVAKFDAERVVGQFESLEKAVIDACSMIYLQKIGLLKKLAQQIELLTTQVIFRETGFEQHFKLEVVRFDEETSPDLQLIHLAEQLQCPLVSDDGQMLKMAQTLGIDYFNSLIMLFFLYFKQEINRDDLLTKKAELMKFAYYAPWIENAAEKLLTYFKIKNS